VLDELVINLWGLCTWHILKMALLSMESVTELCSQLVVTCPSKALHCTPIPVQSVILLCWVRLC